MAEKEIYRLEINVGIDGDEKTKKKLSAMDKYTKRSEKRMKQLDKIEASPAVKLQDKLSGPLKKLEGKVGSFAKTAIKRFAAIATAGAVLVGGFGLGSTMKTFMDFEQGLSGVQAVSMATAEEMRVLTEEAKRLGRETEWSAVQVTEAEMLLSQAGFSVQETVGALPGLLSLASAGGLELADATDIAAGTLRAFGLEADQAAHIADVLAVASSSTNSDVMGLGESMKYVGPAAKALGIDVEQTTSMLGMLANANIKGSQAGTTMRAALTRLAKPSKAAATRMKELGINAFDSAGKMLPMHELVGNLQKSTAGLTEQQKANAMATIFGQEAMSGMLALVDQGPDKLKELTDSLYESEGAAKEMADIRLDNLAGQMTILKSATEGMKIELGERLAPYTRKFVEWTTANIPLITDKIMELVDKVQSFATKAYPAVKEFMNGLKDMIPIIMNIAPYIVGIGSAIATIKIGNKIQKGIKDFTELKTLFSATVTSAGGLGKGISLLMGPVGWVALAIGALVTIGILLWKNWDTIKEKAGQLGGWISDKWNGIKDATSNAWESVKNTVSDKWNGMKEAISNTGSNIKNGVTDTWDNIKTGAANKWEGIKSTVSNSVQGMKDIITTVISNLPSHTIESFTKMKDGIKNIFEGTKAMLSGYWKVIKNIFMGAMLIIMDIVTLDFDSLKTDIANIWSNIKDGFSQIWEGIKQVFSGAGEFIKGYLTLVWEGLKNGIQITWTTITNFLTTTWENIKTGAVEGWTSFKEDVANVISSSIEWIKETWSNTVEWFTTLPSRLYEKGVDMFNSLKDGLASMKESVVSGAKEIGTGIVDTVKSLPGQMVSIGKDIMHGLADGIKSMVMAPINAAKNVATGIADGIRGKLKIKSPSRVMMEYGEFTTEGLAVGMEERIPRIQEVVGSTYRVITSEQEKENKITRQPLFQKIAEKAKDIRPFSPKSDTGNSDTGTPAVAVTGAGGQSYNVINIDNIDVNVETTDGNTSDEDLQQIVEDAQTEFGRQLLEKLRDKK